MNDSTAGERIVRPVLPHDPTPSLREIDERAQLADELRSSLERVRKTAENWRTGVAGLASLVTATLLFKGQDKIDAYAPWARFALGALALLALALAIASLWLFLLAAYGRVKVVNAQSVVDDGGPEVRDIQLAETAVDDMNRAQGLALASAVALAATILLSWYGPKAPAAPLALVKMTVRPAAAAAAETVCGVLVAQDGATTVVKVKGEPNPRRFATPTLVASVLVEKC